MTFGKTDGWVSIIAVREERRIISPMAENTRKREARADVTVIYFSNQRMLDGNIGPVPNPVRAVPIQRAV